ncbi:hypothetical protein [Methylobacterium trifolii]|uniref:Uncharacterized protein n=1 Tax=Methylobacterium trifolii TaxID=1003092 RepID=A0ABQ4U3W2_9HYPH|nr:hypothetical protein [Methylobacterium trifolii]GJE60515.1 hypothetical protein MPOCJGCO_2627 [Methylobacterium trifolii]
MAARKSGAGADRARQPISKDAIEAKRSLVDTGRRAVSVLAAIMDDAAKPAAPRVMAAKALVELSGIREVEDPADKELHEMTREELTEAAATARAYLAELDAAPPGRAEGSAGGLFD